MKSSEKEPKVRSSHKLWVRIVVIAMILSLVFPSLIALITSRI